MKITLGDGVRFLRLNNLKRKSRDPTHAARRIYRRIETGKVDLAETSEGLCSFA
jgi:hypothetical protein